MAADLQSAGQRSHDSPLRLLDAHHDRWAHVLYAYPGAGHPVGTLVPYEPTSPVTCPIGQ
jgi:hypothetical protein